MNTSNELDCPWCSGPMTLTAEAWTTDATVSCADCSIVVELAPDPVAPVIARAA